MYLQLQRFHQDDLQTLGFLRFADKSLFTLELPWRFNYTNISCIPAGKYEVELLELSVGVRIRLKDVPGRTLINIEIGNVTGRLKGCIAVGISAKSPSAGDQARLTKSSVAWDRLRDTFRISAKATHVIEILDPPR